MQQMDTKHRIWPNFNEWGGLNLFVGGIILCLMACIAVVFQSPLPNEYISYMATGGGVSLIVGYLLMCSGE
jgi:hypothetical protein